MSTIARTLQEIPDRIDHTIHRADGSTVQLTIAPSLTALVQLAGRLRALQLPDKPEHEWTEADLAGFFEAMFAACGDAERTTILGDPDATPPVQPLAPGVQLLIALDLIQLATHALGQLRPHGEAVQSDPTSAPSPSSPPSAGGPPPSTSCDAPPKPTPPGSSSSSRRSA